MGTEGSGHQEWRGGSQRHHSSLGATGCARDPRAWRPEPARGSGEAKGAPGPGRSPSLPGDSASLPPAGHGR